MRHSPRRRTGHPVARAQHREERTIAGRTGARCTVPSAAHEPPDERSSQVVAKDTSTAPRRPVRTEAFTCFDGGWRKNDARPLTKRRTGGRRTPWERFC
jgi:hypothetical protein